VGYIWLGSALVFHIISHLASRQLARPRSGPVTKCAAVAAIFASLFGERRVFLEAVHREPWGHLGFATGVVAPVLLHDAVLILMTFFSCRALRRGLGLETVHGLVPVWLLYELECAAIGLALASPAAGLFAAVDMVMLIVRLVCMPAGREKED